MKLANIQRVEIVGRGPQAEVKPRQVCVTLDRLDRSGQTFRHTAYADFVDAMDRHTGDGATLTQRAFIRLDAVIRDRFGEELPRWMLARTRPIDFALVSRGAFRICGCAEGRDDGMDESLHFSVYSSTGRTPEDEPRVCGVPLSELAVYVTVRKGGGLERWIFSALPSMDGEITLHPYGNTCGFGFPSRETQGSCFHIWPALKSALRAMMKMTPEETRLSRSSWIELCGESYGGYEFTAYLRRIPRPGERL